MGQTTNICGWHQRYSGELKSLWQVISYGKMNNRKNYYDCSEIYSNFHYVNVTDTSRHEEGLGRKSYCAGFVLFMPRWEREDEEDHALHQVLEGLQMQKTTKYFLSFQRHIKTALLQKRARNPSENLWVPPNIWIKLPELASQKNHIKYQSQSTCIKSHKNLSVSHSPIFLSTGFWLFDCCLIRLFLIVHIT